MPSHQRVATLTPLSPEPERAARPVTDTAMLTPPGAVPCAWQAAALATYARELGVDGAHLRAELATRALALTGCVLPERMITADHAARRATAALDGVVFQLQGQNLTLLRPCAHCATGFFESPPIESRSDLGYALAAWAPYHPDCAPADPPDETSW